MALLAEEEPPREGRNLAGLLQEGFGAPVDFAFEVVCALAGIVIAFALPQTSLDHGHVAVEFLDAKLSKGRLKVVHIATRWIGIVMFVIIGGNAFRLGARLARAGQHSAILEIPDFPFAYALGVGCLVEALVLFHMVLRETGEPRS